MDQQYNKVYIIESPSAMDVLDTRKEGAALSAMLSLAEVPNIYFNVANKSTLRLAFERIVADIQSTDQILGSITLHFSMHGNKEGVGLTSDEFLTWQELYLMIKKFNDSIGYGEVKWAPNRKFGFAHLNFSVCHGFNAIVMCQYDDCSPFTTLLGPTKDVGWSDSLIAFSTYYHLTIQKEATWKEAVPLMNYASGAGDEVVFKLQIADGLYVDRKPDI